ncbi:hypothetical protein DF186_24050, partial [Enterococcus hirae]
EEVVATTQEQTAGFTDDVDAARQQLDRVRDTVSDDDLATAQRGAARLADRLEAVADTRGNGTSIATALGLGERVGDLE